MIQHKSSSKIILIPFFSRRLAIKKYAGKKSLLIKFSSTVSAKSILDFSWMKDIKSKDKQPIIFIAEGLFIYFEENELKKLFAQLATHFPNAEMFFEAIGPLMAKSSKIHDTVSKTQAKFKWGILNSKKLEMWDKRIKFIQEWHYVDRHHKRWRWIRFFTQLPLIKKLFAVKIIHIKFKQ